jgi:uncharacterized repeat protein (TIGR03943 family)
LTHLARGVLLLGLAGLIAKLLWTGQMGLYLSPAFDPLSILAALVLAGMGAVELSSFAAARGAAAVHGHESLADQALTYLLVLLPIGLGLGLAPRALGSAALGGQDVTRLVVAFSATPASGPVGPPLHPIADVADLFSYLREAGENGVGQPVHLVGIVARGDNLPSDQFVLLRYSIVHCVADAQPIGLLVQVPPGQAARNDDWVELDGTLSSSPRAGASLISIAATRITPTNEPPYPYLQSL